MFFRSYNAQVEVKVIPPCGDISIVPHSDLIFLDISMSLIKDWKLSTIYVVLSSAKVSFVSPILPRQRLSVDRKT